MRLPEKFRNRKLQVIIRPAEEHGKSSKIAVDIDQALQSLIGAIPYTGYVSGRIERGTAKEV